ncbi:MAG: helix-turn-helix domain-containing protein, partial [Clostridiales bacterium]|nr:helix-turn-helix domain-containing protein [Clostridiales bacterium]
MYIKHDREVYHKCLLMLPHMQEKCLQEGKTFFGVCHGGLGEYVTPISSQGIVLGTVNVGFFLPPENIRNYYIHRLCRRYPVINKNKATALYNQSFSTPSICPDFLLPTMEMLASYLSLSYESMVQTHSKNPVHRSYPSSEDTILSHACQYIRQNFVRTISVEELAQISHCSESYVSRIFKKRTGININTYINKVRVEASKDFLLKTDLPISAIGESVGFNDPNYYSRVFTQLSSIPPREYRRRFALPFYDEFSTYSSTE